MEFEVYMVVDVDGNYGVGCDAEQARAHYTENIGALEDCEGFRVVKVKLDVPLPVVVTLTGTAPAVGEAELASVS